MRRLGMHEFTDHRAGRVVRSINTDLSKAAVERNLAKLEKLLN